MKEFRESLRKGTMKVITILLAIWALTEILSAQESATFADRVVEAALGRLDHEVRYDPAYVVLDYPGGDVPSDTGVCTDVVIRAYRAVGFDLQELDGDL